LGQSATPPGKSSATPGDAAQGTVPASQLAMQAKRLQEELNAGDVKFAKDKVQLLTFIDESMRKLDQYQPVITEKVLRVGESPDFKLLRYDGEIWSDRDHLRNRDVYHIQKLSTTYPATFQVRIAARHFDSTPEALRSFQCSYSGPRTSNTIAKPLQEAPSTKVPYQIVAADSTGSGGGRGAVIAIQLPKIAQGEKGTVVCEMTRDLAPQEPPSTGIYFDPRPFTKRWDAAAESLKVAFHVHLRNKATLVFTPRYDESTKSFRLFDHPCRVEEFQYEKEEAGSKWQVYCAAYDFGEECKPVPVVMFFDEAKKTYDEIFRDRAFSDIPTSSSRGSSGEASSPKAGGL
jgi:hypothetical protein